PTSAASPPSRPPAARPATSKPPPLPGVRRITADARPSRRGGGGEGGGGGGGEGGAWGLWAAGHFLVDFCQGVVPALLPFLVADGSLSYTDAGGPVLPAAAAPPAPHTLFG